MSRKPSAGTKSAGTKSAGTKKVAPRPVLATLSAAERGELLDQLLLARPDLRELVETLAAQRMSTESRDSVALDVEDALSGHDIDDIGGRAGYRRGHGYVDPGEAAYEILDEALEPFLDDLKRRATMGMTAAAVEIAAGILLGLYECRGATSETVWEYAPDYAGERADDVVSECRRLGVELPLDELVELMPDWDGTFERSRPHPAPI